MRAVPLKRRGLARSRDFEEWQNCYYKQPRTAFLRFPKPGLPSFMVYYLRLRLAYGHRHWSPRHLHILAKPCRSVCLFVWLPVIVSWPLPAVVAVRDRSCMLRWSFTIRLLPLFLLIILLSAHPSFSSTVTFSSSAYSCTYSSSCSSSSISFYSFVPPSSYFFLTYLSLLYLLMFFVYLLSSTLSFPCTSSSTSGSSSSIFSFLPSPLPRLHPPTLNPPPQKEVQMEEAQKEEELRRPWKGHDNTLQCGLSSATMCRWMCTQRWFSGSIVLHNFIINELLVVCRRLSLCLSCFLFISFCSSLFFPLNVIVRLSF